MRILALERQQPGVSSDEFKLHLRSEADRVWELYQSGLIREMYFRQDRSDAVLVLETTNVEAANAALGTLPLVKEGLITFELIPLRPYTGLARLFAKDD